MRILIADDEELTRKGLINSIHWDALSITELDQADDGVNAYELALKNTPDILLTDVRMPRMDGIELSRKVKAINPDCAIIFMSGYSDKEYLKAAISLKALRYVEKPIVPEEIEEAITESVELIHSIRVSKESHQLFEKEAEARLSLALTQKGYTPDDYELLTKLGISVSPAMRFTTMIIKMDRVLPHAIETNSVLPLMEQMNSLIHGYHMRAIHTLKHSEYLIFHLYSASTPDIRTLQNLCSSIQKLLSPNHQFYLVVGKTVKGLEQVYESYHSAVLLIQNAFFYDYGSVLFADEEVETNVSTTYFHAFPEQFQEELVTNKDFKKAQSLLEEFYQSLKNNRSLLVNTIKDLYYKLFMMLSNVKRDYKLTSGDTNESSLLERINSCYTFQELNQMLITAISELENACATTETENATIFLIKEYISKNYSDDGLSIKDISEHVHLSSSYLCTVFKTETGMTLNQYLTNYRIDKAKQLLADPRNKVNEISSKVGYADGNYFGKTFKKVVGLSPSEYREKELS